MRTEYSDEHRTTFIPMKATQLHTIPKTFDFPGIKLPESSGLCTQLGRLISCLDSILLEWGKHDLIMWLHFLNWMNQTMTVN